MSETWAAVPGYENLYEVSDQGNVRSLPRSMTYPSGRVMRWKGKLLTPGKTGDRVTVCLGAPAGLRSHYVHDLVLSAFVGECPPGHECCHWNGNGLDNKLPNLRWDTRPNNNHDRVRHGTHHMRNRLRCPREHALRLPNLVGAAWRAGHRACLACNRAHSSMRYAIKIGKPFDLRTESDAQYVRIMGIEE